MLETISLIVVLFALFSCYIAFLSRIPKRGRYPDANAQIITATITNTNKAAEKVATLRAKADDGRKFKVKMTPTEAKMWIKGDIINVALSSDKKKYRVLFHEYFKANESRLREEAIAILEKKIPTNFISAKLVGYNKESLDAIKTSEADSQTIFTFSTLMHLIDVYSVIGALFAVVFAIWFLSSSPEFGKYIIPLALILMFAWVIYGTVTTCKNILKKL